MYSWVPLLFTWNNHNNVNSLYSNMESVQFSSVGSLTCVWLFATPWTTACQASLAITNSRSLCKPCHLSQWCHPTISSSVLPSPPTFNLSQHHGLFKWVSFSHHVAKVLGVWPSASVLSIIVQDWFPIGWTGRISLQSKGLSSVFSNTTVQKHQFFGTQLSL